ncbi:MAG: hypothetical protein K0R63_384 [Rickettsiales bacterium]|jgi:hypothetical protein|nr:hypothetical protein [Rickettsiales bacterium]
MSKTSIEWDIDDSSDEEGVSEARENYDLEAQHEAYLENPAYTEVDQEGYSAAAHMLGVELLYSPEVSAEYYSKKRELLADSTLPSDEDFTKWVRTSVRKTVESVLSLSHHKENCNTIAKAFLDSHPKTFNKTVETLLEDKRTLFKEETASKALTILYKALDKFLAKEDVTALENTTQNFTVDSLTNNNAIVRALVPNLNAEINWLKQQGFVGQDGWQFLAKERRAKAHTNTQNFTPLQKYLFAQATAENRRNHITNVLSTTTVARYKLEKYLHEENNKQLYLIPTRNNGHIEAYSFTAIPQEPHLQALYENHPELLKPYIICNVSTLKTEMAEKLTDISDLEEAFIKHLHADRGKVLDKFERKTLPQTYTFESPTGVSHLANLRLSNRSERRAVRQMQAEQGQHIDGEMYHRSWRFGNLDYLALETHEITKRGGRTDLVNNLANYKDIADQLTQLRENINRGLEAKNKTKIGDPTLARAIKSIVQGDGFAALTYKNGNPVPLTSSDFKLLRKNLVNVAYLLFGTEAVRNPSSLVLHPMLLDLVIANEMSWKKALSHTEYETQFGGGMMPMSMGSYKKEGKETKQQAQPVPCARALQDTYEDYLPWKYRYPGESQNDTRKTEELVRREAELTKTWVEKYASDKQTFSEKISAIRENAKKYFGLVPE